MNPKILLCVLVVSSCLFAPAAYAINCSGLPTSFTGNEFPKGNFFSNFNNPCYLINLRGGGGNGNGGAGSDLNAVYWEIYYKVDPRYQLIILGEYPNARYFSVTAYDSHDSISQTILDTDIVPVVSYQVNPFQPGVAFVPGQKYVVPVNFGGTPGTLETGCMMNGFNVDVNGLDATQRHQGMNWNTDSGLFQKFPKFPLHVVDTPAHTNPNTGGYIMIRAYLDITSSTRQTEPHLIVRDVASGCAYPAAYAIQNLQIVTDNKSIGQAWIDQQQKKKHQNYAHDYLVPYCYGKDSHNAVKWSREVEYLNRTNPDASYIDAPLPPALLPATLAAAGEVMRVRLRVPIPPPTPCTDGCSRSGNEQMRYMSLSFLTSGTVTMASLADSAFTTDPNGYATLIVGTGAVIPSWITPANGYTFLDLTALNGYEDLASLHIRNILPSASFGCSGQVVPYNTGVYTPAGNLMSDYLPVVDHPLASSLPPTAAPLVGPSACGAFPAGQPAASPNCGVDPSPAITISSIPPQAPTESPVAVQALPPITINGAGFGLLPPGLPFTGESTWLLIIDVTQNWSAGYTASPCNIVISNWTPGTVELVANVNQNGLCPLVSGDQLNVSIWNPQTNSGPATATVTVAPN